MNPVELNHKPDAAESEFLSLPLSNQIRALTKCLNTHNFSGNIGTL